MNKKELINKQMEYIVDAYEVAKSAGIKEVNFLRTEQGAHDLIDDETGQAFVEKRVSLFVYSDWIEVHSIVEQLYQNDKMREYAVLRAAQCISRLKNRKNLESHHSDSEDFFEVSIWELKEALEMAYDSGINDGQKEED